MTTLDSSAALDSFQESAHVQAQASAMGFDWPHIHGVLDKVEEELREIREAVAADDFDHARRELGDLLLITVNLARFLDTDPAEALRAATARFSARFSALKREVAREGRTVEACTLEELDAVWNRIKNHAITAIEKRA